MTTSDQYGFDFETLIGGLHQPNDLCANWFDFYKTRRLLYMAGEAVKVGRLSDVFLDRLERLGDQLNEIAPAPRQPSLLHGDLWGGNVLSYQGNLTGFIDPAIYYGHPEMDLAFSTLFNTFGTDFFAAYNEINPIEPGFKDRIDLYNLYPLLVHVRLFGGSYVSDVDRVLRKYGC
ncbi:fructosamine kinase family protein [Terasakiella sp. A23]|uniref:fructosamine kinase family protein n=1 Tax=Terasakiella sp. FCG-A23 TaxID=3080561 RepID=UPI00295514EC|nr:fructosamine kinase family protein [Terasakiella sp. A23]MDV7341397.1 fructosamine kinase family protein [Terasakiella sp. A23]